MNYREYFPVTRELAFLNNAAESPLNTRVRARLEGYLEVAACRPHKRPPARQPVRPLLARLLGGLPEEYALVTSTGVGIGLVAAGFPWETGDNLVVPAGEHWNNMFPWLALRGRGVDVRVVPVAEDGRVRPEDIEARIDARTRIVAVAAVRHVTGFRSDLRRLSEMAHARGALLVVDGIQGAGTLPMDVEEDGIDVLAAGGFKWLLGMPGTGFLYVRQALWDRITPALPGMFAAEDDLTEIKWLPGAQRYETGSLSYSLFHAWTAGLEMLLEIGVPTVHARVLALTTRLIEGLRASSVTIVSPVDEVGERSAIVSFTKGSAEANQALLARLTQAGILVSLRGGSLVRVSPAFYNTEQEIDRLLDQLAR